jgi:hypothetical protein
MSDSLFESEKLLPSSSAKIFRAVHDMKTIARHDTSPEYHAKNSCDLAIASGVLRWAVCLIIQAL